MRINHKVNRWRHLKRRYPYIYKKTSPNFGGVGIIFRHSYYGEYLHALAFKKGLKKHWKKYSYKLEPTQH